VTALPLPHPPCRRFPAVAKRRDASAPPRRPALHAAAGIRRWRSQSEARRHPPALAWTAIAAHPVVVEWRQESPEKPCRSTVLPCGGASPACCIAVVTRGRRRAKILVP